MQLRRSSWLAALVTACAVQSPAEQLQGTTAEEQAVTDTARYSFEGSLQGWTTISKVCAAWLSYQRPFSGSSAMALTFKGVAGTQDVSVSDPPLVAGDTITAHVYVPWGAKLDSLQLYVMERYTWKWTDTWVSGTSLTEGAWNTLTLQVPAKTQTVGQLGVEVSAASGWYGTLYVDSIAIAKPSIAASVIDAGNTRLAFDAGSTGSGGGTATGGGTAAGGGTATGGGTGSGAGGGSVTNAPGLHVTGNHIYTSNNVVWHGRGTNVADMRSCNACTGQAPNVAEVMRRIDELVDVWKVNFIRLDLESYASSAGWRNASNYQSALYDPQYLADIRSIVQHVGTKPGVYVLVSMWIDPSIGALGRPTIDPVTGTDATWKKIAGALADQPQALFGIINEPQQNYDGSGDATVWDLMNQVVSAIRDVEDAAQVPYHVVTVQGTGAWSRRLDYYATHPIAARGGQNVAYELHVYNPSTDFTTLFERFAPTLPIIIGEFGPESGIMTQADCTTLMDRAQALEIPHLAWTFHMRCNPSLIVDSSNGGCGVNMPLTPTSWGTTLKARLSSSW